MSLTELEERGFEVKVSHLRLPRVDGDIMRARLKSCPTAKQRYEQYLKFHAGSLYPAWELREQSIPIHPCGGYTRVEIVKDDVTVAEAEAFCNVIDNFNKAVGRAVALGRAEKLVS